MKKNLLAIAAFALLLTSCETKLVEKVDLIPLAENVEIHKGAFPLSNLQSIQVPDEWKLTADNFVKDLQKTASLTVSLTDSEGSLVIVKDESLSAEAYRLNIEKNRIKIEAGDIQGVNHGLASLLQLIMTAKDAQLPVLTIQDKPAFGYRGLMLDCARHFWTVDELKETLDHMAFFKLNTLHMHLTDNQAWRLSMDKYPDFKYTHTQPYVYETLEKYYPDVFDELKEKVKNGQFEPVGAMYVEPDCNIPTAESLVRQCLYGQQTYKRMFGKTVNNAWLPDVFGYTAALPQIIKKCGMDTFMTIKLSWNNINDFPHHTFIWNGLDDSKVIVHMPPEGDYNSNATPYAFEKIYQQYKEKQVSDIALMPFGIGDGGGGPGEYHINMAKRCESLRYIPNVKMSSSEKFFDELKKDVSNYPEYKGELYLEKHQGTYTTQGKVKKNNRRCEVLLHFAEWICTMAYMQGKAYPHKELEEIWKEVLLYQFHDILPGSSIHRVYEECNARYEIIKKRLNDIIDDRVYFLCSDDNSFVALNSIDFERTGYLKHNNEWYRYSLAPYSSGKLEKADLPASLHFSNNVIENEHLKVVFNNMGQIEKIVDKPNNYNCVSSSFNAVRIYKDRFVHPYNAWDIDINYTKHKPRDMKLAQSREYCDGNSVVRENKFVYNSSSLVQRIILTENCPYIKVENEVDWHETHKMLRIDAYPKNFNEKVLCDIQFGNIQRSTKTDNKIDFAQFEIPAHKWVDVYDGKYGVAILNDCKYGHRVKDGLISLNCLRSPVYPDKTADRGEHSFTYAIYPHKKKPMESELVKIGYELNNPVRICKGSADIKPLITCNAENIILETVFVNDNGNIAFRMYETAGKETDTEICINTDYESIHETDMLFENAKEMDLGNLHFNPFEIKTLEVKQ